MNLSAPITNEAIQKLPLHSFEGAIHVIDSQQECEDALSILYKNGVIGFDTETKPTFQKGQYHPTAIIQMSTEDEAFLFRLLKIPNPMPLFRLMEDPAVTKLGISIMDDLKDLNKVRPFTPQSFIDLNHTAREIGIQHMGVRKLAAICLGYRISKGQQTSNWENEELSEAQRRYAATDAWICLAIHNKLKYQGYLD